MWEVDPIKTKRPVSRYYSDLFDLRCLIWCSIVNALQISARSNQQRQTKTFSSGIWIFL